jgi:RNA polymerase-binding transcription factor DksA
MMTREAQARKGGTTLHPEVLAEMEETLKRRKSSLMDDVLGLERSWTDHSEMDPAHSSHMAESGTDAFDEELRLARMESAGDEIFEIEEALRRIREGIYGTCESCAAALPVGRLRAIPYARLCLACKAAEEAA